MIQLDDQAKNVDDGAVFIHVDSLSVEVRVFSNLNLNHSFVSRILEDGPFMFKTCS